MVRLSTPAVLELRAPQVESPTISSSAVVNVPTKATRLVSLDAFRGAVILVMLLVNNTALNTATPPQLTHADWNKGLHLADLVFPWFLFTVGVSIPFSTGSFFEKDGKWYGYLGKVFLRSLSLLALGMLIDCMTNKRLEVSMGILQLIGLAYFVAAIIYLAPGWLRAIAATFMLGGYALAMMNVAFPGAHAGVFEENRNLFKYLDDAYLVKYNLDGMFATIPAAGLALFGTIIGDVLRNKLWSQALKVFVIGVCGYVFVRTGFALSEYVPFNKPECTPSYVMIAGGTGAIALAMFLLVVDMMRLQRLAYPLVVFGANAIAAYVFPIIAKLIVFQTWTISTPKGNLSLQIAYLNWLRLKYGFFDGSWAYTATYIGFWWIVLAVMYRKRLFLRV